MEDPRSPKRQRTLSVEQDSSEDEFWATTPEDLFSTLIGWPDRWPIFEACYDLKKLIPVTKQAMSKALISRWVAAELAEEVQGQVEVTTDTHTNFLGVPRLFTSTKVQIGVCVQVKRERGEDDDEKEKKEKETDEEKEKVKDKPQEEAEATAEAEAAGEEVVPLVCMEVQARYRANNEEEALEASKRSYDNTLAKLTGMLIHQLRAFRNFDTSIVQVCGFMFPRLDMDSALVKITVSWQKKHKLTFGVEFQVFRDVAEARDELKSFFSGSAGLRELDLSNGMPNRNLVPLTIPEDLEPFGATKQIPSNSSIILYCPGNTAEEGSKGRYLKYNPSFGNGVPWEAIARSDVVVKATRSTSPFYKFEEHKQIHFEEAKAIRHKFVKAVADSLDKLHKEEFQAHLDVRLPNICYDEDGVVRFIDFDRSMRVGDRASYFNQSPSNMYKATSKDWTMGQLDWKQFGLLIGELTQENYDVENPPVCSGPIQGLLDALVNQGRWDEEAYQAWVASESHL